MKKIIFIAFIAVLSFASCSNNNDSNKSSTNTSNDSYVSLVSEIKQGLSEISDDIASDISEVKENSSEMSDNAQTSITKEEYLSQVKESIEGAVGSNEEIKDVVLEDKVLTIFVDISQANVNAPIEFPLEEIAVSRASSITDEILGMDTNFWQKVVVDFGDIGTVTNTKDEIINGDFGDYFDIKALDNTEAETSHLENVTENSEFISKHETDIVVAAKMALDNFISKYKLSLAPQNWTIAKYDSTNTVIAMTEITYNNKIGNYIYVGTLNINDNEKVESAKPHFIYVIDSVLGDDGYCDDVFEKLANISQN